MCGFLKRKASEELFTEGIRTAWAKGEMVRFMTLTAPSEGMTMRQVYEAWNRVRAALKYSGDLDQYAGVIEFQKRGEPHLHLLVTGQKIDQKRLSKLAVGRSDTKSGRFGEIADIRKVRGVGPDSAAGYMTKALAREMSGYVAKLKEADELRRRRLIEEKAKRVQVRPVRLSRGWYPGGFAAAEAVAKARMLSKKEKVAGVTDWTLWQLQVTGELKRLSKSPLEAVEAERELSEVDPDSERGVSQSEESRIGFCNSKLAKAA